MAQAARAAQAVTRAARGQGGGTHVSTAAGTTAMAAAWPETPVLEEALDADAGLRARLSAALPQLDLGYLDEFFDGLDALDGESRDQADAALAEIAGWEQGARERTFEIIGPPPSRPAFAAAPAAFAPQRGEDEPFGTLDDETAASLARFGEAHDSQPDDLGDSAGYPMPVPQRQYRQQQGHRAARARSGWWSR